MRLWNSLTLLNWAECVSTLAPGYLVRSVSERQHPQERGGQLSERERTKVEGRFGMVLLLLILTVFFSISASNEPWVQLLITVVLAANLGIAMWASGVRPKVVQAWWGVAVVGIGASIFIATTQDPSTASGYLAITGLLLDVGHDRRDHSPALAARRDQPAHGPGSPVHLRAARDVLRLRV
jgi:hypothetical protein